MRFHMLHNIDTALHFLRCKNVKLVNIRSEDIVDGNPKLTLGLIWTIILHFQVSPFFILHKKYKSKRRTGFLKCYCSIKSNTKILFYGKLNILTFLLARALRTQQTNCIRQMKLIFLDHSSFKAVDNVTQSLVNHPLVSFCSHL